MLLTTLLFLSSLQSLSFAEIARHRFMLENVYKKCTFAEKNLGANNLLCTFKESGVLRDDGDLDREKLADLVGFPHGSVGVRKTFDYCVPVYRRTKGSLEDRLVRFNKCVARTTAKFRG